MFGRLLLVGLFKTVNQNICFLQSVNKENSDVFA